MPFITKQFKFCAAHRYWNTQWSKKKNKKIFEKDINLHGHNYQLNVTIFGPINPESGFIINLSDLNLLIKKKIIEVMDHSQIEKDIEWFHDKQPSTENMVEFIWEQIACHISRPARLHCIKLQETPTIFTEYFGPDKEYDEK